MTPYAVLIGMPGAGKSTVGRAVAHALGMPFADSDSLIIQRTGQTIPDLFATEGEQRFRAIEADVIVKALRDFGGILALGGGSIVTESIQRALEGHRVVMIDADNAVLADRLTHSHNVRPLLQADPRRSLATLRKERDSLYRRVATHILYSNTGPAADVARRLIDILAEPYTPIDVGGAQPYTVHVGRDLVQRISHAVAQAPAVMIVHAPDAPVAQYASVVADAIGACGKRVVTMALPAAEAAKDISAVTAAWDFAGEHQIGRDGMLVAIGGGATTDVGGFVAATWLRGIPFVTVPTTVLGMVDAAVGGKTGINTSYGKNLVGSFYPPQAVVCDMNILSSLPLEEIRAGLGEVIKCGFIRDRKILEIVAEHGLGVCTAQSSHTNSSINKASSANAQGVQASSVHHNSSDHQKTTSALQQLVERSVAVKAAVVSNDLKETGMREILNYGHTLAHAIELNENYHMRHGEAVAIGCVFAAALSEAMDIGPRGFTDLHRSAFAAVGLPISYRGASRKKLLAHMYSDKKVRSGHLRFVVLKEIGEPIIVTNPPREALAYAFTAVGL